MCVSRRGSCVLRVGKRRAAGPRAAWVARASTPSMGRARGGARVAATILHGIVFGSRARWGGSAVRRGSCPDAESVGSVVGMGGRAHGFCRSWAV